MLKSYLLSYMGGSFVPHLRLARTTGTVLVKRSVLVSRVVLQTWLSTFVDETTDRVLTKKTSIHT